MDSSLLLPIFLVVVLGLLLVFSTRKQKKMAQAHQDLQKNLAEGDRVMTTSGLYATVADVTDDTSIDLEIAPGVVTTWLRQAIREKVQPVVDEDGDEDGATEDAHVNDVAGDGKVETAEAVNANGTDDSSNSGAQIAPPLEHGKK